jgi:hypothetical protein
VPTEIWADGHVAWASSETDVWRGPLEHFDGVEWVDYTSLFDEFYGVQGISGSGPDNVWFTDGYHLLRKTEMGVGSVEVPAEFVLESVPAVHSLGEDDTWVAFGEPYRLRIIHYDGVEWTEEYYLDEELVAGDFPNLYIQGEFIGSEPDSLLLATGRRVLRREGGTWSAVLELTTGWEEQLRDIAYDGTELWVLLTERIYRVDEGSLIDFGPFPSNLTRIDLTPDRVWNFDGSTYRTLPR